jgi:hypothetical protein
MRILARIGLPALLAWGLIFPVSAFAEFHTTDTVLPGTTDTATATALRIHRAMERAPIKSSAELREHEAAISAGRSPISKLSKPARKRFVESLTFNERGLTGLQYADLRAELAPADLYRTLALFGYQHLARSIAGDSPRSAKSAPKDGPDQDVMAGLSLDEVEDDGLDDICWNCFPSDWGDLFLFQPIPGKDHYEFKCDRLVGGAPTSTCVQAPNHICTRNC